MKQKIIIIALSLILFSCIEGNEVENKVEKSRIVHVAETPEGANLYYIDSPTRPGIWVVVSKDGNSVATTR